MWRLSVVLLGVSCKMLKVFRGLQRGEVGEARDSLMALEGLKGLKRLLKMMMRVFEVAVGSRLTDC